MKSYQVKGSSFSMVVGFDFYGTITVNPKIFRQIVTSLLNNGHTVYIISAVKQANISRLRDNVKRSKVPHSGLEVVMFEDFFDIPRLKLAACKRLGVNLMFDDNPETQKLLSKHRIFIMTVV